MSFQHASSSSRLSSFADAEPLGPDDEAFVAEFRDLLAKHGNANRFGLCLLHEHFAVSEDELLFESNDPKSRTLTLTTEKRDTIGAFKPTMWRVSPFQVLQGCGEGACDNVPPPPPPPP